MKRVLTLWITLLILSAPALAQEPTTDPAAALPADTALYIEMRTDAQSLSEWERLLDVLFALPGITTNPTESIPELAVNALVTSRLPNAAALASPLTWAGERIGFGVLDELTALTPADWVVVLPIRDEAGAQAFIDAVSDGAAEDVNGVELYDAAPLALALNDGVIWIGTRENIDTLLNAPEAEDDAPADLSATAGYQKLRAALPQDAPLSIYVDYAAYRNSVALPESLGLSGAGSLTLFWHAALQLHPAASEAENALLTAEADGFGMALEMTERGMEVTAAASASATYAAPTLTTTTAGTALLDLIPADSFAAFASYDLSVPLMIGGAAAYGWSPSPNVQQLFQRLMQTVAQAQPPDVLPPQPFSAETLLIDLQPLLRQAESTMGIGLDELYGLINGEYAFAAFPGRGPTVGTALYLQSSDPARLISMIELVSERLLTDPAGTRLIRVERTAISGTDVALVRVQGGTPLALGVLNGGVLFATSENSVERVLAAAGAAESASGAVAATRAAFGDGQEALLYLDAQLTDLYNLGYERSPSLPFQTFEAALDVQENGLVVLRLVAAVE